MQNKYIIAIAIALVLVLVAKTYINSNGKNEIDKVRSQNPQYIDVRTVSEYEAAHNPKALNIPLDQLNNSLNKIDNSRHIVVVCASGVRSARAKKILETAGFPKTYNGGAWTNIPKD